MAGFILSVFKSVSEWEGVKGMTHKKLPEEFYPLMEQLQAIDFVLVELTLYLDTHPNDQPR